MKIMVIYDSIFGNTEKIAQAIGSALGSPENVGVVKVTDVKPQQLNGVELLIVGSPTRGFRPTKPTMDFLKQIAENSLKGVRVAAFDTRVSITDVNSSVLTFMVNLFGYAAQPIANQLKKKGGILMLPSEGFFVKDREGPLKEGELNRAVEWGRLIASRAATFPA
jgi:flavodoxin I